MAAAPSPNEASARLANILVVVALAAMLTGAVVLLAAREPVAEEIPVGETQIVVDHAIPDWQPLPQHMVVRVFAVGNLTLRAEEVTGTNKFQGANDTLERGEAVVWREDGFPGERWQLTVTNNGNETARVTGSLSCDTCYWAGGVLVAIGVLGFVFYRVGMRRS